MNSVEHKIVIGLSTAFLLLGIIAGVTYKNMRELTFYGSNITYTLDIFKYTNVITKSIVEIKTSVHSYIISNNKSHLSKYHLQKNILDSTSHQLVHISEKDPFTAKKAKRIHQLLHNYIKQTVGVISKVERNNFSEQDKIIYITESNIFIDELNYLINYLETRDRILLRNYNDRQIQLAERTNTGFILTLVWVFIILIITFSIIRVELKQLRKSEQKQREVSELLDGIIENSPAVIFVKDLHGKYLLVNNAANSIMGYETSDMIGKTDADLIPKDMADKLLIIEREIIYKEEVRRYQENFPDVNDNILHFYTTKFPLKDKNGNYYGICGISIDITAKEKAEIELKKNLNFLNNIINYTPSLVYVKDINHNYVLVNQSLCNLLDLSNEQIIGKSDFDLWNKDLAQKSQTIDKKCINEGITIKIEESFNDKYGNIRNFITTKFPLRNESDEIYAICSISNEITERVNAENELNKTKSLLHSIIEYSPSVIFTKDLQGRYTKINSKYAEYLQIKEDDCIGKTDYDFFPKELADQIYQTEQELLKNKKNIHYEHNLTIQGKEYAFITSKFLLYNKAREPYLLCGISTDISDRYNMEKELIKTNIRYTDLYNNAPSGYHSVDEDGYFVEMNATELTWLGYTSEELILKIKITDILDKESKLNTETFLKQAFNNELKELKDYELVFIRKDGSKLHTLANTSISKDKISNKLFIRTVVVDISDRKMEQKKIEELNTELAQNNERLKDVISELEAFTYSVSHDLRAPLRAIDGFTQILKDDYAPNFDVEGNRLLNIIMDNSVKMGHLIDDLLEFARLGKRGLNRQEIDLNTIVNDVIEELGIPEIKNITLHKPVFQMIMGDKPMIKQVWLNLLSNALKYSSKQEQIIISISVEKNNENTIFKVQDNGVGFDMTYSHKLFSVFQRLHSQEEFEGTGVGLAIVQRIVTRHNGRVWAESELNKGSIFYFSIPNN